MSISKIAPRLVVASALALGLAACAVAPPPASRPPPQTTGELPSRLDVRTAVANFATVVGRVEPVAESLCRARTRGVECDFRIVVDDRPGMPPNAFQTIGPDGRPIVGFTVALIADARNQDEIAFVLGHEAAHHIAGHISRSRNQALAGAILAGTLASLGGADANAVAQAQNLGAAVGSRRYSKDFELEADALGVRIAMRAGYDAVRGAEFFARLPDPGNRFLGTHPPTADRLARVRATAASL